jgi:hypothetical protein
LVLYWQVGISRLVEEGSYTAAFPLHDVSIENCSKFQNLYNTEEEEIEVIQRREEE